MADENDAGTSAGQDGTGQDQWTPPTREEWEQQQADHTSVVEKLRSASAESAQRKKTLAELKQQHETDAEKAAREAQEAAGASIRPKLVSLTATVATAFSDARPERLAALLKLVDFEQVDLDTAKGLDDEVARLREEFPEFFRAEGDGDQQQQQPQAPARAEVGNRKPTQRQLSPLEQLTAQVAGAQSRK